MMGHVTRLLTLVALLIGLAGAPLPAEAARGGAPTEPGRYIVMVDSAANVNDVIDSLALPWGSRVDQRYESVINGFAGELTAGALWALSADPRVTVMMPDLEVSIAAQTIPAGISRVGATANPIAKIDGVDERVDVDVAVLDTGVGPHADLNVAGGKDCTGSGSYADGHGHGTHVAGTIGAIDNGAGVVGVAPGARIWSVKVLNSNGSGYGSWILCGIDWVTANANTIEVANMSLGGATSYVDDNNCGYTNGDAIHRAICRSVGAGITYVVAAGNDSKDAAGYFPAQYDEVITVSALTTSDTLASFSNYGHDVDVIAPGVSVYSTAGGGGYATMSGTSMAAPHAAGAAALYTVANGGASPASVRSALISTGSTSAWSGDKDSYKEALIDVSTFGSVPATHDAEVTSVSAPASVTQGTAATVNVSVRNNGSVSESISVALTESPDGFSQTQSVTVPAGESSTVPFTWGTTLSTTTGTHTFSATASVSNDSNGANNTGTATTNVAAPVSIASMSVSNMTLTSATISSGHQLSGTVTVESGGAAVDGASVSVEYTDPNGSKTSQTATTNPSGIASFSRTVTATGTYTVTVMAVTKTGYSYDASKNVVTSTSVTIQSAPAASMSVSYMSLTSTTLSTGYRLNTRVDVASNGTKISGASVTVEYTYPDGSKATQSATTNTYGYAMLYRSVSASGAYTVTVTNIAKADYSYDPAGNAVTSKSITIGSSGGTGVMSVSSMTLSSSTLSGGYRLNTRVYIQSNGAKVSGASVTIEYGYPNGSTVAATATTNTYGYAAFYQNVSASGTYTVTVKSVTKSSYSYDASKNAVTSKSITIGSSGGGGTGVMSVSSMTLSKTTLSTGYRLYSRVYIKSDGAAVSGAAVTVQWTYPNGSKVSQTATTNKYGYATFSRSVSAKGTYTVTITNVTKSGSTYNPGGNTITSKSLTI